MIPKRTSAGKRRVFFTPRYVDYLCGLRIYYLNEMHSARESAKKKKNPKEVKSKPKSPPLSRLALIPCRQLKQNMGFLSLFSHNRP